MTKLTIYRTRLTPARNALVDELETYLGTCEKIYENTNFQYLKLGLEVSVRIELPQALRFSMGNYARIEQDNKIWYFFVMDSQWLSANTTQLNLSIDSVNTFRNDLTFTDKTSIERQHGQRWEPLGDNKFTRVIDHTEEGILPPKIANPLLIKDINASDPALNMDWFLIYRTRDDLKPDDLTNPVRCYCVGEHSISIPLESYQSNDIIFRAKDLSTNIVGYYVMLEENPNFSVSVSENTGYEIEMYWGNNPADPIIGPAAGKGPWVYKKGTKVCYRIDRGSQAINELSLRDLAGFRFIVNQNKPGKIYVDCITTGNTTEKMGQIVEYPDKFSVDELNFGRTINKVRYSVSTDDYTGWRSMPYLQYTINGQRVNPIMDINSIDRSSSRNIKIIRLPYAPCHIESNYGIFYFPEGWEYKDGMVALKPGHLTDEFLNENLTEIEMTDMVDTFVPSLKVKKSMRYESKLYHSNFTSFKLIYDNFAKEIKLEDLFTSHETKDSGYIPTLGVSFKPTSTINSKFAFKIDWMPYLGYEEVIVKSFFTEDYQPWLLATRNNEETIFTNDYINYIRNGYNYDKKAHAIQKKQGITEAVIGGISAAAGTLAGSGLTKKGSGKGKYALKYTAGVPLSLGISLASQAATTAADVYYNDAAFNNDMEGKLAQLSAQSTGTEGTDDIDLLKYYNHNRLQMIKYTPAWEEKRALFDLFYYFGYKHKVHEIPDFTSRCWFNYVQCDPVFADEELNPYNGFIEDVKERYNKGITNYHEQIINGQPTWDWDQRKENWENILF